MGTQKLIKLTGYDAILWAVQTPKCKLYRGEKMDEVSAVIAMSWVNTPREQELYTWRCAELPC